MYLIRRLLSAFSGRGRATHTRTRATRGRSVSGGLVGAIKGFLRGSRRPTTTRRI